jgi:hypothetical protein
VFAGRELREPAGSRTHQRRFMTNAYATSASGWMAMNRKDRSGVQAAPNDIERALNLRQPWADRRRSGAGVKARQSSKIRELGHALVPSGFHTLDEQANALGLPRTPLGLS